MKTTIGIFSLWGVMTQLAIIFGLLTFRHCQSSNNMSGLSLDPVPDDVPDPVERSDAPRTPDVTSPSLRPGDQGKSRGDLHVTRIPG